MSVHVSGVGMTPFGRHEDSLRTLAVTAAREAIKDAGISPAEIDFVVFANAFQGLLEGQEAVRGQVALRELGLRDGTPIVNVESACASGSSAVYVGRKVAEAGDRVLVVGAEKMYQADKRRTLAALATAQDVTQVDREEGSVDFMEMYAVMARQRMEDYGLTLRQIAAVAAKNTLHGSLNDLAQYRTRRSVDEVLAAPIVAAPLTRYMCSPISDGAAAVVLDVAGAGPVLRACALVGPVHDTDVAAIRTAATRAYEEAGLGIDDIDVVEVHDASAVAEIAAYEALGLCEVGFGGELAESGATTLGGVTPVNVSGGLLSRGHPVGATGLAQLVELVSQLRGRAGGRQVPGARVALAENHGGALGLTPAAVCVTILSSS